MALAPENANLMIFFILRHSNPSRRDNQSEFGYASGGLTAEKQTPSGDGMASLLSYFSQSAATGAVRAASTSAPMRIP